MLLTPQHLSRRTFLLSSLGMITSAWTVRGDSLPDQMAQLSNALPHEVHAATLARPPIALCVTGRTQPTLAKQQGPFYSPKTPQRSVLVAANTPGTRLKLSGRVLTPDCQPVPGAALDFWQADAEGNYDNTGFHLRGHQQSERDGAYALETVKPAPYWAFPIHRTPHLHVKVHGKGMKRLTTQLYFPDEMEQNRSDHLFHPELLVDITTSSTRLIEARFDVVLERT